MGTFDNVEEDKVKKQQYLNEHIVKAGYDKFEFAEYMAEWKDNGTDIDEWALIELMDMVEDFKRSNKPQKRQEDQDSDNQGGDDHEIIDTEEEDKFNDLSMKQCENDIDLVKHPDLAKDTVTEVKTQISRTNLSYYTRNELKITVSEGQVKKGGMFSFSYATYKITVEPIGWNIRRKEEEFQYLRKYLWKAYPNQYIPPLIMTSKKLTEHAIQKKEEYFTKFLVNVLRNK